MAIKKAEQQIKLVDDWTVRDWEIAYNVKVKQYDKLRETLRRALQVLNTAV